MWGVRWLPLALDDSQWPTCVLSTTNIMCYEKASDMGYRGSAMSGFDEVPSGPVERLFRCALGSRDRMSRLMFRSLLRDLHKMRKHGSRRHCRLT